jgi:hypothetical protein
MAQKGSEPPDSMLLPDFSPKKGTKIFAELFWKK